MENTDPTSDTSVNLNEHQSSPIQPLTVSCANQNENFFQFPSDIREKQTSPHRRLSGENTKFVGELNKTFQKDVQSVGPERNDDAAKSLLCGTRLQKGYAEREKDYEKFTKYLQSRSMVVSSLEFSTDEAIKELSSLYSILDELSNIEETLKKRRLYLNYATSLSEHIKKSEEKIKCTPLNDQDVGHTKQKVLSCDESRSSDKCDSEHLAQKLNKQKNERTYISDDITFKERDDKLKECISLPIHKGFQHRNTYSEGKSKVSKWTKVKAAFKWERATVPAFLEKNSNEGCAEQNIGLVPNNFEVARYLRVPSHTCVGTSSTDSILSSSSGHVLSEIPTSSTLSSASSVDDVKITNNQNSMRRDFAHSEEKHCYSHLMDCISFKGSKEEQLTNIEKCQNFQNKPCCNKSLRKSKLINDFEVLPENVEANIKSTKYKLKLPPSPLNLDQKQDLNDLEEYYIMQQFKSPKGMRSTYAQYNHKSLNSPANSSVPSSPSRLSDFFAELESEEVSSGDFSDPTTPNHLHPRKSYQQKQDEIHKKYEMLRKKLDMEFEAKQRKWEKSKVNPNICRVSAYTIAKSPTVEIMQSHTTSNVSTELLEESLSPDFKKKLQKWRVKKQERMAPTTPHDTQPSLGNKDCVVDAKTKIDWNLWKSGQIKLEGQGLSPLPHEKDLPEDFQKKLEQWNKIKKSSSMICTSEGWKRSTKHSECVKKGSHEEEKKSEKLRVNEKDKLEKLSKLKTIVTDHPSREIEVKTSAGVMKFEGISRKFTRRLYEWEKSRGIGPESSTFALLHPGYCPLVVGRVSEECHKKGNSPTLSRSFSLDSLTPNTVFSTISKQASSLSLNDVNELKEMEVISSNDALEEGDEFKSFDEPEAVIVEVEDHIEETASPLFTSETVFEQQIAVSKYEEDTCKDYCKTRHVQSYKSCSSSEHMFIVLVRSQELLDGLSSTSACMDHKEDFLLCQSALALVLDFYPYSQDLLTKQHVLKAVADVEHQVDHFAELHERVPLDEACCQEIMKERCSEYGVAFRELKKSLDSLRLAISFSENSNSVTYCLPGIKIITDDGLHSPSIAGSTDYAETKDLLPINLEVPLEHKMSPVEDFVDTKITVNRTFSNCTTTGSKRKLRTRKLGSRQNSKTESSDSSDEEMPETPRRWKRKNYRIKQRSYEEDLKKPNEELLALSESCPKEDCMYLLKIKRDQSIKCDLNSGTESKHAKFLISPNQTCVELLPMETPPSAEAVIIDSNVNSNIFVKTKRKIFHTIEEPHGGSGIAFVEQDLDCMSQSEDVILSPKNVIVSMEEMKTTRSMHRNATSQNDLTLSGLQQGLINSVAILSECPIDTDAISAIDFQTKRQHLEKSWSCFDFGEHKRYEIEKSSSVNSFISQYNDRTRIMPLATDSLEGIYKSCTVSSKDHGLSNKRKEDSLNRVKHFSKCSQKNVAKTLNNFKSALVRRIEKKYPKTYSRTVTTHKTEATSSGGNKFFTKPIRKSIDSPSSEYLEPSTHVLELIPKDVIPSSDRAQRLQKAKLNFLKCNILEAEDTSSPKDLASKTLEALPTLSSNQVIADSMSSISILRDSSTDSTHVIAPTQSDADLDYTSHASSIPTPQHSAKHASKLSFISFASKLLRVRCKHEKKLTDEVMMLPQRVATRSEEIVQKSKSSAAVLGRTDDQRSVQVLNKSQSDQYVLQQKIKFG